MQNWFTPERRKALYTTLMVTVPTLIAAAVAAGFVSTEQVQTFVNTLLLVSSAVASIALAIARKNVPVDPVETDLGSSEEQQ